MKNNKEIRAVAAIGGSILGSIVVKKGAKMMWKLITKKEAPVNPNDPNVTLTETLIWGVITGLLVAGTRVILNKKLPEFLDKIDN